MSFTLGPRQTKPGITLRVTVAVILLKLFAFVTVFGPLFTILDTSSSRSSCHTQLAELLPLSYGTIHTNDVFIQDFTLLTQWLLRARKNQKAVSDIH